MVPEITEVRDMIMTGRTNKTLTCMGGGLLFGLLASTAGAATLFGATHGGSTGGASNLYTIDTTTGAGTLVGSIGFAVTGLTYDATTGTLFGTTSSSFSGYGLLGINMLTGAGSLIGSMQTNLGQAWGVTANSAGALFGWTEDSDDLVSFNKATGVATVVGAAPTGTANDSLAFDSADVLHLIRGSNIWQMDTGTGGGTLTATLPDDPGHHGTFASDDAFWSVLTNGNVMDSVIRVSDLDVMTSYDIDTDVSYLHTLAFAGSTAAIPVPASLPLLAMGLAALGIARRRKTGKPA